MKISLDPNLERAFLRAAAEGVCLPTIVDPKELSKKGQAVHGAIVYLFKKGATAPLKPASILLAAHSLYGFPKSSAESYLKSFSSFSTGPEIAAILKAARDKVALVEIINQAGGQLASGHLDRGSLEALLSGGDSRDSGALVSIGNRMGDKFPKPARGEGLPSLPEITRAANGISGIWVVGGEPGLGKSTLANQVALDYALQHPVAYYDIDGTGEAYFNDRIRVVCDDNVRKFKALTKELFYRDTIEDIESDLRQIKPPALIVVDSIQTLPASRYSKDPMGDWLARFKALVKKGYAFLCVSEKPRSQYGQAELAGFKNSGSIEYGGTLCAHLLANEDDESLIEFRVVKNRHGPRKGHIVNLLRDEDKVFWFTEEKVRSYADRPKEGKQNRNSR